MIDRMIARRDTHPVLDKAQMTRRIYRLIRFKGMINTSLTPKAMQLIKNCLIYIEEVTHRMTSAYYNTALGEEEKNKSSANFATFSVSAVLWSLVPITWLMTLLWGRDRNFFTRLRESATEHFSFLDPRLCEAREDVLLKEAILELLKYFIEELDPQKTSVNDVIKLLQKFEKGSYRTRYVPLPASKALAWKPVATAFRRGPNDYTDVIKLTFEYFADPAEVKSDTPEVKSHREEKGLPAASLFKRPTSQTLFKYSGDISTLNNDFARLSDNISSTHLNSTEAIPIIYQWLKSADLYMEHNWQSFRKIATESSYETIAEENFRIGTEEFRCILEAEKQNFMTLEIQAATRPLNVTEEIQKTLKSIAGHAYVPGILKQQAEQLISLVDAFPRKQRCLVSA